MCVSRPNRRPASKFKTGPFSTLRAVTVAGVALSVGAAGELPANQRALDEAATFLTNACESTNPADLQGCRGVKEAFMFNYLRAMSGDTLSMKNLASYFSQPNKGVVSQSRLRSCSWAMIAAMSDRPTEDGSTTDGLIDTYCQGVPPNDLSVAKHLASVTSARITAHPATVPHQYDGDRWPGSNCDRFDRNYLARGRFAPPACKPSRGPLDSSVSSLVP